MIVPSIFGDLASQQNLQGLIDNSITSLYSKSIWRQYLDWGLPQLQLTFETVIGRSRIEAAASIVDTDAPAPVRSRAALELLKGKIPTMKEAYHLNQQDYRALLQLQSLPVADATKKAELIKKLYNDVENAVTSTDKRLDIMFLQAISTFQIDISVLNNPDGVAFDSVPLLAAPSQTRFVSLEWSNASADPFKDIDAVVTYAAGVGRSFNEIWMDRETWLSIKNLAAVKSSISGYLNPGSNKNFVVTQAMVNEYLVANQLPPIKVINERRGIEKDGIISTINPFKKENVVFMPAGKVGIVHNAMAIEQMQPVDGVTYATYDKTLLSKWRDNNPWREYTQVELNAFPALEAIDGIYILKTDATS